MYLGLSWCISSTMQPVTPVCRPRWPLEELIPLHFPKDEWVYRTITRNCAPPPHHCPRLDQSSTHGSILRVSRLCTKAGGEKKPRDNYAKLSVVAGLQHTPEQAFTTSAFSRNATAASSANTHDGWSMRLNPHKDGLCG